jgi:hypothetical protein
MNIKRLLNTSVGVLLISILLGFGVACLFRKVCTDGQCIHFKGAVIDTIHGKIYEHDNKCFKYMAKSTTCSKHKKIIDVSDPISAE